MPVHTSVSSPTPPAPTSARLNSSLRVSHSVLDSFTFMPDNVCNLELLKQFCRLLSLCSSYSLFTSLHSSPSDFPSFIYSCFLYLSPVSPPSFPHSLPPILPPFFSSPSFSPSLLPHILPSLLPLSFSLIPLDPFRFLPFLRPHFAFHFSFPIPTCNMITSW